jgi:hypothetical protein
MPSKATSARMRVQGREVVRAGFGQFRCGGGVFGLVRDVARRRGALEHPEGVRLGRTGYTHTRIIAGSV